MIGPQSRKLPETLARLNRELRARHDAGLCTEIADVDMRFLRDDRVGLFARVTFIMEDGSKFTLDTREFADMLRAVEVH